LPGIQLALNTSETRKVLTALIRLIYDEGGMPKDLDQAAVNAMAKQLWAGVEKGYNSVAIDYDTPDKEMIQSLQKDVWQFSGAKNFQQMKAMSEMLVGPDGKLRSFSDFKRAVSPITNDHITWLRTEYKTAVASSQMSAKWVRIQRDKELFPLLQFNAVLDDRTTELCKSLDGVVLPVDDPFWRTYYPPNHFNCRSDVRQLRAGEAKITPKDKINYPDLPKMFLTNVAMDGLIFPKESPYYIGLPDEIRAQAETIRANYFKKLVA